MSKYETFFGKLEAYYNLLEKVKKGKIDDNYRSLLSLETEIRKYVITGGEMLKDSQFKNLFSRDKKNSIGKLKKILGGKKGEFIEELSKILGEKEE